MQKASSRFRSQSSPMPLRHVYSQDPNLRAWPYWQKYTHETLPHLMDLCNRHYYLLSSIEVSKQWSIFNKVKRTKFSKLFSRYEAIIVSINEFSFHPWSCFYFFDCLSRISASQMSKYSLKKKKYNLSCSCIIWLSHSGSDDFYLQLQGQIDRDPGRNMVFLLGDFNTQVDWNRKS